VDGRPRNEPLWTAPIARRTRHTDDVEPQDTRANDTDARLDGAIEALGDDVFHIDTRMGGYTGITSGYLIRSSRPCLVETGTARSADLVVRALAELGIGPDDLATIVVTHIHLDHAGGVGDLAEVFPHAQVVVHERGARHLADPSRLVASAHRVFGPDMDRLFGDLRPVPQDRLVTLAEVGEIDLGDGRVLAAFHNPGHASHHVGLLDSQTGDLYTGDAAGVYVPETADVRPATPPPDFDLALTLSSLRRMKDAQANRLLFSHFGPVTDVADTLERSEAELRSWVETVAAAHAVEPSLDHAIAMVREKDRERHPDFYADAARVAKFDELSGVGANVSGIIHWLDKQSD
jgi:glyoxylase-like metal-dependent hydrolase (beta-lactamase superfamily II)